MKLFKFTLRSLAILLLLLPGISLRAGNSPDEGMWMANLASHLNFQKLRQMGLQLNADDIYNEDKPSLKDAVVQLGMGASGFCTAEFVSANGLLFTNHHCGFEALASVSTTEHNYIEDGYWAMSYAEEIPIPGLWIRVLVQSRNITDSVKTLTAGMNNDEAEIKVSEIEGNILQSYSAQGYVAELVPMYYGNEYYVYVYKQYDDVRFTGAPPSSIGNFGGDTDNWMWPRHTGDFSVFRVYADKDNLAAEYNTDNVPYSPKKFLKISLDGYSEGDFTMIMGFPGNTERYLPAAGVKHVMDVMNPTLVDCFSVVTENQKKTMDSDDSLAILLAANYAQFMNGLKLFKTQIDGMHRMDAVGIKQAEDKEFKKWAESKGKETMSKYNEMFQAFDKAYADLAEVTPELYYKRYAIFLTSTGGLYFDMQSAEGLFGEDVTEEEKETIISGIRESAEETWKVYNAEMEKNIVVGFMDLMYSKLPESKYPQSMRDILSHGTGMTPHDKFVNWTNEAFAKSVFSTPDHLDAFLNAPKQKKLQRDPLYQYYAALYGETFNIVTTYRAANASLDSLQKEFVAALMEKEKNTAFYPDANFTMRLTYGTVQHYEPRDAVTYYWQTTLDGVIEKMDSTDKEFIVPDKLYKLYLAKDYGRYANKNGDVPVCFISNLDITGGNSGSPIMNGKGELLGLAFDGNYEGTPGDYIFEQSMNRTISVDIRYVLFVIDKFAGAQNLMKELVIVK